MPTRPLSEIDLDHILTLTERVWPALAGSRLFITGGTGFFGHWLLESMLHANRRHRLGLEATVLTRDATAFCSRSPHIALHPAIRLLEGDMQTFCFPPERHSHVLHVATDSGGQQAGRPAHELADAILAGTRRTLEFALSTGARRYLFTSTGAVYGRSTPLLHTPETYAGGPDPLLLQSAYDEAKRMAEHLCVAYSHGTELQCAIARPFAFVGPHLPLDAHFAIGNFIGAAIAGTAPPIRGDGTPRRSFLYMADLAIWLWTMLEHAPPNRAYNVGSPEGLSIRDLAQLTMRTLRPDQAIEDGSTLAERVGDGSYPHAPLNSYVPDITRAQMELGLDVSISLPEAIRRTAAWHNYVVR